MDQAGLLEQRLIPRPSWHEYFLSIAKVVSTRSTCSSRPVGCVIVRENRILVTGYNGVPSGYPHCSDKNKKGDIYCARRASATPDHAKLEVCLSVHAEQNAMDLAEQLGIGLDGAIVYTTLAPCVRCIERLRNKGIASVFYELAYRSMDVQRDALWEQMARDSFEHYEQVNLSDDAQKKLVGALVGITSERLLPSG